MRVLGVFFVGLIFGWLRRWVIDKIFLEDNVQMLASENDLLRQRIQALEAPRAVQDRAMQRPAPAPLPVEEVEPVAAMGSGPIPPNRDDLKMIKGVGPQNEKKLNTAGVYTFDQMSRLTTEQLQAILGVSRRNVQNTDNLINQASEEVVHAVEDGQFHSWAIDTADEGIALMTGKEPGERQEDGSYPENTLYRLVHERLEEFAKADERRHTDEHEKEDEEESEIEADEAVQGEPVDESLPEPDQLPPGEPVDEMPQDTPFK